MAIYNKTTQQYLSDNKTLFEVGMIASSNGNPTDASHPLPVYNTLPVSSGDWRVQVGRGKVAGITAMSISGYNPAVDGSWVPLWENGAYTYLSSAQNLLLWSSSASDTNVSVLINGLDANYNMISETLVLTNGTTGVPTVNQYFRINSINLTAMPMAVGTIYLGTSNKSITSAIISIGTSRSAMSIYTIPAGYSFLLEHVLAYSNQNNNQVSTYRSYTRSSTGIITTVLQFPFTGTYDSVKTTGRLYPEKTDCQWQCTSSAISAIGIQIEGLLIQNTTP
jgi:hypothetical protein